MQCRHRHTGQFCLWQLSHLCPKKFFDSVRKTPMLACKITLPNLPHPVIISKKSWISGTLSHWAEWIPIFRLINTLFSFLGAGFCLKSLAFAWKIMVLPESGGRAAAPQPPGSYAYECKPPTVENGQWPVCSWVTSVAWSCCSIKAQYVYIRCKRGVSVVMARTVLYLL